MDRAIDLLTQMYIMCLEAGDFANGITCRGIDEGEVQAGRLFSEVADFLQGCSPAYDVYASLHIPADLKATTPAPADAGGVGRWKH